MVIILKKHSISIQYTNPNLDEYRVLKLFLLITVKLNIQLKVILITLINLIILVPMYYRMQEKK